MKSGPPPPELEKRQNELGKKFGIVFYYTHNEWCNLWLVWKQFENLFGHGPERVELLNKAGGSFFCTVDRVFFEAAVLAVCRLSDPIKTGKNKNMTVMLFLEFMDTSSHKEELGRLLDNVKDNTEFARDWRNRKISHNDYELKLGSANPLKTVTRDKMNAAIDALHNVFAYIAMEFSKTHLSADVIDALNNEIVTLRTLYDGIQTRESELAAMKIDGSIGRIKRPDWLCN